MRDLTTIVPIRFSAATNRLTPAALALAAASACSAGIVNPGGSSHIWTGAVNSTWGNAGNWTTGTVPADGDAVVINGSPSNIFVTADTASLTSLYVAGGMALTSNGNRILVNQGFERTTVNGIDTRLFLPADLGGAAAFVTDELDIEDQARLQLVGGRARVNEQLTMTGGARIDGYGRLEVVSAEPVALNGFGGASIDANNGELEISVTGGGQIAVPPVLNINNTGSSLVIDAPFFAPVVDVNMDEQTTLEINQPWALAGVLDLFGADGVVSQIIGDPFEVDGTIEVNNGILEIDAPVLFNNGSNIAVGTFEELALLDSHDAAAGAFALVSRGGVLRIGADLGNDQWEGDITLAGGVLSIDAPQTGEWDLAGTLTLGSWASTRSRVEGSAPLSLYGDVALPGLGAEFDIVVYLRSGATMDFGNANTRLILNSWFSPLSGTVMTGDGRVDISETGTFRAVEPMNLAVDVLNAGSFQTTGSPHSVGYTYINGDYTQTATGTLDVDIAGPTNLERDVYETSGDTTLAGELFVELTNGYMPMEGESFDVFTSNGTLTGAFDSVAGDPGFVVSYTANTVVLTFVGCPADFSGDGMVDSTDLASLLAMWGLPGETDLNGDGVTDSSDLAIVLASWGACS